MTELFADNCGYCRRERYDWYQEWQPWTDCGGYSSYYGHCGGCSSCLMMQLSYAQYNKHRFIQAAHFSGLVGLHRDVVELDIYTRYEYCDYHVGKVCNG